MSSFNIIADFPFWSKVSEFWNDAFNFGQFGQFGYRFVSASLRQLIVLEANRGQTITSAKIREESSGPMDALEHKKENKTKTQRDVLWSN